MIFGPEAVRGRVSIRLVLLAGRCPVPRHDAAPAGETPAPPVAASGAGLSKPARFPSRPGAERTAKRTVRPLPPLCVRSVLQLLRDVRDRAASAGEMPAPPDAARRIRERLQKPLADDAGPC